MTLNPRGTDAALWGLPDNIKNDQDPLMTETETAPSPDREHKDAGEEVPLFQDEPPDGFGQRRHTCPKYPVVKLALVVLATLALFVALPCTMLAVDKQKAMHRMQAPGAIQVKGVSVDVSQAVPVVGLNVAIQKSAFPKLTTVHPRSVECVALNADWGGVWVATVQELQDQDTDTARQFYINATMNLPKGKADDALEAFANVAWQLVTQQKTNVGHYKCHIHLHAKIAGIIEWKTTFSRAGVMKLEDVGQLRTANTKTIAPTGVPGAQQQQQQSYVEVHQLSAENIVLGFHLHIPQSLLEAIPEIRIHLPMLAFVAQLNGSTQSIQLSLEEMDLSFSSENDHNHVVAEVSCGNGQIANKNSNTCAWYSPLLPLLQDTLDQKQDNRILNLYVQANNSFLQRMVGSRHAIVLHHQTMTHRWSGPRNEPRRRQLEDNLELDCVRAQSAPFGDIFDFKWCMNVKLSKGLALDGYLNFYGYGGSWKGELEWQRTGNTFWLEGVGKVELELAEEGEETMMDLQGSAMLDLENLKVALYANNTAKWLPFRCILEGRVEYLEPEEPLLEPLVPLSPTDIVVFRLDNATFTFNSEQYVDATGSFSLDKFKNEFTAVLIDPRLEIAMDGSLPDFDDDLVAKWSLDDHVVATWRVVYDGADITTGSSAFAWVEEGVAIELQSAGKLTISLGGRAYVTRPGYRRKVQGFEVTQALLEWDGVEKMDVRVAAMLAFKDEYEYYDYYYEYWSSLCGKRYSTPSLIWTCEVENIRTWLALVRRLEFALEDSTHEHAITLKFGSDIGSSLQNLGLLNLPDDDNDYYDYYYNDNYINYDDDIFPEVAHDFQFNISGMISGEKKFTSAGDMDIDFDADYFEGQIRGNVGEKDYSMSVDGKWGSTEVFTSFFFKGNSVLTLDDELLWSEYGEFSLKGSDSSSYSGTIKLLSSDDSAEVQFFLDDLSCEWDGQDETFTCTLSEMTLAVGEKAITDSSGDMLLDLPARMISLDLVDDFETDKQGYILSISGDYADDVLSGKIDDLTVVSGGDNVVDATAEMKIDLVDTSMSFDFEDLSSETLMAVDRAGWTIQWGPGDDDDYDYDDDDHDTLELIKLDATNMRMVIEGEPWVHGGTEMGLNWMESTIWMTMDNNTTKLPMDFDFAISLVDDTLAMSVGAGSLPSPPSREVNLSPTASFASNAPETLPAVGSNQQQAQAVEPVGVAVNTTIIVFNTQKKTAEFLSNPENAAILSKAFDDFIANLMASMETNDEQRRMLALYRSLELSLLSGSAVIHGVQDVDCPTGSAQSIPAGASCQAISGAYEVAVTDEDPVVLSQKFAEETKRAIEEGKLQQSILAADPQFPVKVFEAVVQGTVVRIEPPKTNSTATTTPPVLADATTAQNITVIPENAKTLPVVAEATTAPAITVIPDTATAAPSSGRSGPGIVLSLLLCFASCLMW